jgi:hypothetical protein
VPGADSAAPGRAARAGGVAILGGLVLTAVLHGLASLALIAGGSAWSREGPLIVFAFWAFVGLAQWAYLLPAALAARALGWRGLATGLWIGGALGVAFTVLLWGWNAVGPLTERITGNSHPNVLYSGSDGVVVAADASQVTVRFSNGDTETYHFVPATRFGYLGPAWQQQRTPAGPARLAAGARVNVDWVRRSGRRQAERVSVWVETPE